MTAVALRATGVDDLESVLAMEADPDTRPWLGETGPGWHADALADAGVEHLVVEHLGAEHPVAEHMVAEHGAPLLGFVVLAGPRGPGTESGTELRRLVVAAEHRGTGHGRAVLAAVLDRVGTGRIWLDVKPGNTRARALYAGAGFAVERELPVDPRDPRGPTALIILARDG